MTSKELPATLYEMLKSFSAMAQTLNVVHAAKELSVTRQTVARHISDLEELFGCKLFELVNRQYVLTKTGADYAVPVETLLNQTGFLFQENSKIINGLLAISAKVAGDHWFHAQHHPTVELWTKAPPLMHRTMQAWTASKSQLFDKSMQKVRPYLVVYRRNRNDWICVEVGEKSSYATWLGRTWAQSAIGLKFDKHPISSDADKFVLVAHENVVRTGNPCYEHVSTKFARVEGGDPVPVNYQKLTIPISFPNGQPGIAAMIARTNNVEIYVEGKKLTNLPHMPDEDLMEFDI